MRFWGLLPRSDDTIHGLAWNLARRGGGARRTSPIFMQSLVEIRRCTAAWEKFGVFVWFSVYHALDTELYIKDWRTRGLVIQIAILLPFVGQFWCGFYHSLDEEMLFQTFEKWTMRQGGATFVLELGQNLNFCENSKGIVCAHDFDRLGEG